jgi:hypothetical protein
MAAAPNAKAIRALSDPAWGPVTAPPRERRPGVLASRRRSGRQQAPRPRPQPRQSSRPPIPSDGRTVDDTAMPEPDANLGADARASWPSFSCRGHPALPRRRRPQRRFRGPPVASAWQLVAVVSSGGWWWLLSRKRSSAACVGFRAPHDAAVCAGEQREMSRALTADELPAPERPRFVTEQVRPPECPLPCRWRGGGRRLS